MCRQSIKLIAKNTKLTKFACFTLSIVVEFWKKKCLCLQSQNHGHTIEHTIVEVVVGLRVSGEYLRVLPQRGAR